MILTASALEKRVYEVGVETIQLCYDTFTQLDAVPVARYSEFLTVGYSAMTHRKARLLTHYSMINPLIAKTSFYDERMQRYVNKRMVDYVNKQYNPWWFNKRRKR